MFRRVAFQPGRLVVALPASKRKGVAGMMEIIAKDHERRGAINRGERFTRLKSHDGAAGACRGLSIRQLSMLNTRSAEFGGGGQSQSSLPSRRSPGRL